MSAVVSAFWGKSGSASGCRRSGLALTVVSVITILKSRCLFYIHGAQSAAD